MTDTSVHHEQIYIVDRYWTEFGNRGLTLYVSAKPNFIPSGDFIGVLSDNPRVEIVFRELGIINRQRIFEAIGSREEGKQSQPSSLPLRPLVTRQ